MDLKVLNQNSRRRAPHVRINLLMYKETEMRDPAHLRTEVGMIHWETYLRASSRRPLVDQLMSQGTKSCQGGMPFGGGCLDGITYISQVSGFEVIVPMEIALSDQPLLGQPMMVNHPKLKQIWSIYNIRGGGGGGSNKMTAIAASGLVGLCSGRARRFYVGNLHFNMKEDLASSGKNNHFLICS
ncbi:splicing factor, CC1-like protein [Actinidia rufa]|uniref:Splicing factor, CC1-like protein n=1 Tax=Actinidia rufa TaxID=165716 RepID=A0A7J0EFK5_9ERIC|nr:splicing factor, CC1-like protein [Actinidia rufa]